MKPKKFYIVRYGWARASQVKDAYEVSYMETADGWQTYTVFTSKTHARRFITQTLNDDPTAFEIVELSEKEEGDAS